MFSFRKSEKLCRKKLIDELFSGGSSFTFYPLRVQYLITSLPVDGAVQAMFTVPKRRFKRAVKRNLLKRRMREAYRLKKSLLYPILSDRNEQLAVAFIYISNQEADFDHIKKAVSLATRRLKHEIEKS